MHAPSLSCVVETDGIAHVFRSFEVGELCACARAVVALSDDERELIVRRSFALPRRRQATAPAPPAGRPAVPLNEREQLLHEGNAAIAYALELCDRVRAERASLHEGRRRRAARRAAGVAPGWDAS